MKTRGVIYDAGTVYGTGLIRLRAPQIFTGRGRSGVVDAGTAAAHRRRIADRRKHAPYSQALQARHPQEPRSARLHAPGAAPVRGHPWKADEFAARSDALDAIRRTSVAPQSGARRDLPGRSPRISM
jgi:hypothetical protein